MWKSSHFLLTVFPPLYRRYTIINLLLYSINFTSLNLHLRFFNASQKQADWFSIIENQGPLNAPSIPWYVFFFHDQNTHQVFYAHYYFSVSSIYITSFFVFFVVKTWMILSSGLRLPWNYSYKSKVHRLKNVGKISVLIFFSFSRMTVATFFTVRLDQLYMLPE